MIDVTRVIDFDDMHQCVLAPAVEEAFESSGELILPDGGRVIPKFAEDRKFAYEDGGYRYEEVTSTSTLVLPPNSFWNGLPIIAVKSELYLPPESDSNDTRELHFSIAPRDLQASLARLDLFVPIHPNYRALDEADDRPCGGAMRIKQVNRSSILSCSAGC